MARLLLTAAGTEGDFERSCATSTMDAGVHGEGSRGVAGESPGPRPEAGAPTAGSTAARHAEPRFAGIPRRRLGRVRRPRTVRGRRLSSMVFCVFGVTDSRKD